MLPSVCIIIPTFNQAGLLGRAVDSALIQTYPALQVVVVDDASTDDTAAVVRARLQDGRLQYLRGESNLGRVGNYRFALQHCTGAEWVLNLDGDDYLINPDFVAEAMDAIQRVGAASVLFYQGRHVVRGDEDHPADSALALAPSQETELSAREYFACFFRRKSFSHLTTVYRRDSALAAGFYEVDVLSIDMYSILNLCLENPGKRVILSAKVSGVWYQHATNSSKSASPRAHWRNFGVLSRLSKRAASRGQSSIACLVWQLRLTSFYALLYSGVVWRRIVR